MLRHALLINGFHIGRIRFGLQTLCLFIGLQLLAVNGMVNGMCTGLRCFCRSVHRLNRCIIVLIVGRHLSMDGSGYGCRSGVSYRPGKTVAPAGQFSHRDILLFKGEVYLPLGSFFRIQLQLSFLRRFCSGTVCLIGSFFRFRSSFFDFRVCKLIFCEPEPGCFSRHTSPLLHICYLGKLRGHNPIKLQIRREVIHKGKDDIPVEQQAFALAGMGHIRELVRGNVQLLR